MPGLKASVGKGGVWILRASEGRNATPSSVRFTATYLVESEAVYIASGSGVWIGGFPINISRMELVVESPTLPWRLMMRCQRGAAMDRLLTLVAELGEGVLLSGKNRSVLETLSSRLLVEVLSRGSGFLGSIGPCLRPKARFVLQ